MRVCDQPDNLQTFICAHLRKLERPVVYVFADDEDGTLSMLCGGPDCDPNAKNNCFICGLGHMRDHEPAVKRLEELPNGVEAWLSPEKNWIFTPNDGGATLVAETK